MRVCTVASAILLVLTGWQDARAEEPTPDKSRSYEAGDLGLEGLDQSAPAAEDPSNTASFGVGVSAIFSPASSGGPGVSPGIGFRLWLNRLMVEPLLGFGVQTGSMSYFRLTAGALGGIALSQGNLRPIIGAGFTFGLDTGSPARSGVTFGPMFALEYRFSDLPRLGLDAAIFVPFGLEFDPVVFRFTTSGAALLGFHYFF